jgi:hypothetical protein
MPSDVPFCCQCNCEPLARALKVSLTVKLGIVGEGKLLYFQHCREDAFCSNFSKIRA